MAIEVVEFEPVHLEALLDVPAYLGSVREAAKHYKPGLAFTAVADGRVIAAGGGFPLWRGVAEAWVAVGSVKAVTGRAVIYAIRKRIDAVMRANGLHRMQASVYEPHVAAHRLARAVGFDYEGRMRGYGRDGETYVRYGRVMTNGT